MVLNVSHWRRPLRLPAGSRARRRQGGSGHDAHNGTSRLTDLSGQGRDSSGGRGEAIHLIGRHCDPPRGRRRGPMTLTGLTAPDGAVIVTLTGDLDIASAPAARERLLSLIRPGACLLVIDMSAVRYTDASGLAVLVSTKRRAVLLGGELRLAALRPEVAEVLTVTGLNRHLAAYPTVQAAVADRKPGGRTALPGTGPAVMAAQALPAQAQAGPGADSGASCTRPSPPSSPTPTPGVTRIRAAGSPRPCAHWRWPTRVPATRLWSGRPVPAVRSRQGAAHPLAYRRRDRQPSSPAVLRPGRGPPRASQITEAPGYVDGSPALPTTLRRSRWAGQGRKHGRAPAGKQRSRGGSSWPSGSWSR